MKSLLLFFSCVWLCAIDAGYKSESLFPHIDINHPNFILSFFLPHNPQIFAYTLDGTFKEKCYKTWPRCKFSEKGKQYDLLWIDGKGVEWEILIKERSLLKNATAVYLTTCLSDTKHPFQNVRTLLEGTGFQMLGHWYWENEEGKALFIRKDVLDAALRTLSYNPSSLSEVIPCANSEVEWWFRKSQNRSFIYSMDSIDQIYMINLDERPEKYSQTSLDLLAFGIFTHRFPAVNGWDLPTTALNDVGLKFIGPFQNEKFFGTYYWEIEGKEYSGNEFFQPNGRAYFTLGMSRGSIGIVLSHLSVLQDAWDADYKTIWVMEDDVAVLEDPSIIPSLIRELDTLDPDWDILFTDTDTVDHFGNHVACRSVGARPNFKMEPLSHYLENFYPLSDNLSRTGMRFGAYSMIVRRSGMEKILTFYKAYGIFQPYDMDYWLAPGLKMYTVNRDIVSHRVGAPSDNSHHIGQ